jgi:hypothetical protein
MLFESYAGFLQFVFVTENDASTHVSCFSAAYDCNHFSV